MYRIVGAERCERYQHAKKILKDNGFWGQVEWVDSDSPEGKMLAISLGAGRVPFFTDDGEFIEFLGQLLHRLTVARLREDFGLGGTES